MLRGYPESAVQFKHCHQIVAGPHDRPFIGFLGRSDGLSTVAGGKCSELQSARNVASGESRDENHRRKYVNCAVLPRRQPSATRRRRRVGTLDRTQPYGLDLNDHTAWITQQPELAADLTACAREPPCLGDTIQRSCLAQSDQDQDSPEIGDPR